jgi:hypothetical protein
MSTVIASRLTTLFVALALAPVVTCHAADERQSLEELRNTVVNLLQVLVEQGVITREKATQMVQAAQTKAAADAAALAKADEGAVRVPYVPQIVKDEIAKQVTEELKPAVVADVVQEAKTEQWGVPGALPEWLTRTRISGDATLREEGIFYDKSNAQNTYLNYYAINLAGGDAKAGTSEFELATGDRIRTRARVHLEVDSTLSDTITAGMRLATGNTSDLVSQSQTLDSPAPYAFGLDELFIRADERTSSKFPWLSVVGGRFLNPYETPTDLIFHKDLTFTGVATTARIGFGDGTADQSHVFFTAGAHSLQEIALSPQDKWLVAAELGANLRWGDGQHLRMSGAFYDYFNVTGRLNPASQPGLYNYTAPSFMRQGNTVFNIANSTDPSVDLYAYASKFRLVNVNATYSVALGRYVLGTSFDAVRNVGFNEAAVSANTGFYVAPRTKGYQAQVNFGYPTALTAGAWRAVIGYRYLQRDAVMDEFTDSDFHFGGTDAQGYYFVGDYGVADRVWLRLRYLSANEIDGPAGPTGTNTAPKLGIDTLQFDVNTRF